MKVFIAADMEGITGVVHRDQLMPGGQDYQSARLLMTQDVNAAIAGILSVHNDAEIVVGDGHGTMRNILIQELAAPATLVSGPAQPRNKPLLQLQGFDDSFDAAVMVGYHSMAGVEGGLLAHTYVGTTIKKLSIDGQECGEVTTNALLFGESEVPVVAVTGNSCLADEVSSNLHAKTQFYATKETQGPTCALCFHPTQTTARIQESVASGMQLLPSITPLHPTVNEICVEFYRREMALACEGLANASRTDTCTVVFSGDTFLSAFKAMWIGVSAANKQYPEWMS